MATETMTTTDHETETDHDHADDHEYEHRQGRFIPEELLLDELIDLGDGPENPPTTPQMETEGAFSPSTYRNRFGSWPRALRKAGFAPDAIKGAHNRVSDDELLTDIVRVADELGHPPSSPEYEAYGTYAYNTVYTHLGGWDDALEAAGLEPAEAGGTHNRFPNTDLLGDLQRVGDEVGGAPTTTEYKAHGTYSYATFTRRFGGWNGALEAAGFDLTEYNPHRWAPGCEPIPDDELVADLQRVADEVGGPPTTTEYEAHGAHSIHTLASHFGGWDDVLEAAGFDLAVYRERKTRGYPSTVPTEAILFDLQIGAVALGHSPSCDEYDTFGEWSHNVPRNRFGGWAAALEAAGLPPTGEPVDLTLDEIEVPDCLLESDDADTDGDSEAADNAEPADGAGDVEGVEAVGDAEVSE